MPRELNDRGDMSFVIRNEVRSLNYNFVNDKICDKGMHDVTLWFISLLIN